MKILGAIVAVCLAMFLFYQANDIEGITLLRLGYIASGVVLIVITIAVFVPPKTDEHR
jgi:hypothetical protein